MRHDRWSAIGSFACCSTSDAFPPPIVRPQPEKRNTNKRTNNECLDGVKLLKLTTGQNCDCRLRKWPRLLQDLRRTNWEILVNLGRPCSQNILQDKRLAFYSFINSFFFSFLSFFLGYPDSRFLTVCILGREKCIVAIKHLTRPSPEPVSNHAAPRQLVKGKLSAYTNYFSTTFFYFFTSDEAFFSWPYLIIPISR